MCMHMCIYMCACAYACVCMYIHICIYMFVHVYICVYEIICTHTPPLIYLVYKVQSLPYLLPFIQPAFGEVLKQPFLLHMQLLAGKVI